jgi:hypothetical protein
MKNVARFAAATAVMAAGLAPAGLVAATDAQARSALFPRWCPGDFWDPGWGPNWTEQAATTTGRDLGLTLIPIRTGDRDGVPGHRLRAGRDSTY